jgi:hypothetical protein
MTQEERKLAEIVARIINGRRDETKINPMWIAEEALQEIDPGRHSPELVRLGCHLQLRQIARGQCRKLFEDGEGEDDVDAPRFNGFDELQWRYPRAHSNNAGQPEYVLLGHMTQSDVDYNVARLHREGRAKIAHARLLEIWGREQFRSHG